MSPINSESESLLSRVASGDTVARERLFVEHRGRLRQMIAVRMDQRLSARVDPSDIVQDTLTEAIRQLPNYLRTQPLPFYPWLRNLAWQKLIQLHRQHVRSQKRSISREQVWHADNLSDASALQLAKVFAANDPSPSARLVQDELFQRVMRAMEKLKPSDREILILRHLEQLSVDETAAVLSIKNGTAKARHFRAIQRLNVALKET